MKKKLFDFLYCYVPWFPWGRWLAARMPGYHLRFISLGYNCELAVRYFKHNGFVDSGLFQWALADNLDDLIYAIEHLDLLFTGEIQDTRALYRCANTKTWQHGRITDVDSLSAEKRDAAIEADKQDLRGRIAHLKKKFVRTLRAGGALVAYKIRTSEYIDSQVEAKLNHLLDALRRLGMKDTTFLLVCEEACRANPIHLNGSDVKIRYVKKFNPDDNLPDDSVGDSEGWRRIFDEFRPLIMKKQTHKYKFEK